MVNLNLFIIKFIIIYMYNNVYIHKYFYEHNNNVITQHNKYVLCTQFCIQVNCCDILCAIYFGVCVGGMYARERTSQ